MVSKTLHSYLHTFTFDENNHAYYQQLTNTRRALSVSSPCKGEDEGEGPCTARHLHLFLNTGYPCPRARAIQDSACLPRMAARRLRKTHLLRALAVADARLDRVECNFAIGDRVDYLMRAGGR